MNATPDKRFLFLVLIFGLVAGGVSAAWLSNGDITFRRRTTQGPPQAGVTAQIPGDHIMYYPFCTAWALLGLTMVTLTALAYFSDDPLLMRLSAYSLLAFVLLVVATFLTGMWVKPG